MEAAEGTVKKAKLKKAPIIEATPAKKVKKTKEAAPSNGEAKKRGRESIFTGKKIKLVAKENPKREGTRSYERFELYKSCKTVKEFLEAGGSTGDLHWDTEHGYIEVN